MSPTSQPPANVSARPVHRKPKAAWRCMTCGSSYSLEYKTCPQCTPDLTQTRKCEVCGKECGGECKNPRNAVNTAITEPVPSSAVPVPIPEEVSPDSSSTWKCRYCNDPDQTDTTCSTCKRNRDTAEWKCFNCGEMNPNTQYVCLSCQASRELCIYLRSMGVKVTDDQKGWTHGKCEYKNPLYKQKCGRCEKLNLKILKALQFKGKDKPGIKDRIKGAFTS